MAKAGPLVGLDPVLAEVMAEINKDNPGTIVLGKELKNQTIPRITTGSLTFDAALGGGWAAGQWHEVIGNESHGKTTVILKTLAANMAINPSYTALWVASEPFVESWAEDLGVDLDRLVIVNTNVMQDAFDYVLKFLDKRAVDAIVIDSLPALVPDEEAEESFEGWQVGLGARLTGKFFRIQGKASRRSLVENDRLCTGFVVNQWREKIGVMFGDPRTTPGGRGKNYYYTTRVEVSRDEFIEEMSDAPGLEKDERKLRVGLVIHIRTVKNKSAPPLRSARTRFYFDDNADGVPVGSYDAGFEVATLGVALRVIVKSGAWYSYGGEKWQGMGAVGAALRADPELLEAISTEIRDAAQGKKTLEEPEPERPRRRAVRRRG